MFFLRVSRSVTVFYNSTVTEIAVRGSRISSAFHGVRATTDGRGGETRDSRPAASGGANVIQTSPFSDLPGALVPRETGTAVLVNSRRPGRAADEYAYNYLRLSRTAVHTNTLMCDKRLLHWTGKSKATRMPITVLPDGSPSKLSKRMYPAKGLPKSLCRYW